MKKILSLFFALCIAVCTWADVVASGTCGAEGNEENVTWSLDDEGTLTISGTGRMVEYGDEDVWINNGGPYSEWAEYQTQIFKVVFESGVTNAASCSSLPRLSEVVLSNTIEEISDWAFMYNESLTSCQLSTSVRVIGEKAFAECYQLNVFPLPEGVIEIKREAFRFNDIQGAISFPSTLTTLGSYIFWDDNKPFSVHIPASVVNIEGGCFSGASGITSFTVDSENPKYDSRNDCNAIIETATNHLIAACKNTVIPSSVRGCDLRGSNVEEAIIPEGVLIVSEIIDCWYLKRLVLPHSVVGTIRIGVPSLEYLSLGSGITQLDDAESFTTNLTEVYCYAKVPPTCNENGFAVSGTNPYARLHVPAGCITAYRNAPGWSNFMNIVGDAILIENTEEYYTLTDNGSDYTNNLNMHIAHLHYTRTFNNTNWQPLYVPFSMNYDDWKDNFDVARITNFHSYDYNYDGTIDATYMEFLFVTSGNIEPSYPYLIKAKTTGTKTIDVDDVILQAAEDLSIDCSSVDLKYVFKGNYQVYNILAESTNEYAMQGGLLCQPNGAAILNPFRWHLTIQTRFGNSSVNAVPQRIILRPEGSEDTEDMTSLENVVASSFCGDLYTIDGRFVTTLKEEDDIYSLGLPSGIYIVNKQKVVIP